MLFTLLFLWLGVSSFAESVDPCKADSECTYAIDNNACPLKLFAIAKSRSKEFLRKQITNRSKEPCAVKPDLEKVDDRYLKAVCKGGYCALAKKKAEEVKKNPGYCEKDSDCVLGRMQDCQELGATDKTNFVEWEKMRKAMREFSRCSSPPDREQDFRAVCVENFCEAKKTL